MKKSLRDWTLFSDVQLREPNGRQLFHCYQRGKMDWFHVSIHLTDIFWAPTVWQHLFSCQVQSDSATPWNAAYQASLSFTIFQSLLKFMSIESVMLSKLLILCHPLHLLLSIFPSNRVLSNEYTLHIRWPKYWSFSFSTSPSNEYSGLISLGLTGLISLLSKGIIILQFKSINSMALSLLYGQLSHPYMTSGQNPSFD